jgi:hypothetical protein
MNPCTYVSEEGGDVEGMGTEEPSLQSYTLRYVSLGDIGRLCQEGVDGEGVGSEAPSLKSYTLRYVSLGDLDVL